MITLILRGKLGSRFQHPETGNRWVLDAASPGEALHAIDTMVGGLFDFIYGMEKELQGYHVQVNGATIGEDMLNFRFYGDTVEITPLLQGADTKGVLQIVAGIALIAVGIAVSVYGGPFLGLSAGFWGAQVVGLGLAVSLGGVARLLTSAPDQTLGTQDKTRSSYIFTGPVNTVQQGECVPVAYGDVIIGSAVISAGMENEDVGN